MKLEHLKKKAEDGKDALLAYQKDAAQWGQGLHILERTQKMDAELDAELRQSLDMMHRQFEVSGDALSEQRKLIERQREEVRSSAAAELEKLRIVESKLAAASADGRYAMHLNDAYKCCREAIRSYTEVLRLVDEDAMPEGGAIEAGWNGLAAATEAMNVAAVKTDSISAVLKITPAQKQALKAYTGESGICYKVCNPILRGKAPRSEASPETIQMINDLHGFLSSHVTTKPMTVWRGVGSGVEMVNGRTPLDQYTDEALVGQLLVDGAFVSTSTEESACFQEPTILVLNLPAGTAGVYVGEVSTVGSHEKEFLMDCGQAFRVTGVQRRNGVRYIYANSLRK